MQSVSDLLIKNIENLPIWVKQVLAFELSNDLNKKLSDFKELTQVNVLFQYVKPKTTFKGKQELESKSRNLSDGYYTFLSDCIDSNNTIFEITVKNKWSFADSAKIFLRLLDLEFVVIPSEVDEANLAIASFIASRIRTGELLKRIGKIDATQLDQALKYQKQLNAEGRHIKMASILIKMGFITDQGLDSLLLLKDEAKKRLSCSFGLLSIQPEDVEDKDDQLTRMQKEIDRLQNENIIMKKHLKKLLNIK